MPILGADGTEAAAAGAERLVCGTAAAKSGTTVVDDLLNGRLPLLGKANAGSMTGKSDRDVADASLVNAVPLAGVEDVIAVVAHQGALAAPYEAISPPPFRHAAGCL
ncbi:MAG TPA: hypothetical protein VER37_01220, partial [Thermomicrobiales bacterium]|nr:hypothetical protein [Thermomicrobiales bacterium]